MSELEPRRGPGRPPKYHEQAATQTAVAEMPSPANPVTAQEPARERPNRKPFGALEAKLNYQAPEGFHLHVFNDTPGRIERAKEAGYEHIKDKEGKIACKIVGTAEGGGPLLGYPMIIPEEWWKADMADQQKQVNEKEDTMRRGQLEAQQGDNRYVPAQGIKISHGR